MARLKRFWYFLPVLQLLGVFYGIVQITSGTYVEQYLESVEVCSGASGGSGAFSVIADITKKKLRLFNFPNNTVVIKLTRWNQLWPSFYNFRCQFSVVAPKRHGVMMSIEAMHLRTKGSRVCGDFIKFKGDNDEWTPQICGEVESKDKSEVPESLIGPRFMSSSSRRGEIDVMFYTSQKEDENKEISLSIVFTAFQDCARADDDKMKPCSPTSKVCIPKALFCDNKINCGLEHDYGTDESDCTESNTGEIKRSMSIFVFAVTAVSTLVVVIMCTLIACCCIRKFQKPPRNTNLQQNHIDMEFNLDNSGLPSAPPLTLDRNLHPSTTTKSETDLPPPYAALFPDRSDVSITQPVQKKK